MALRLYLFGLYVVAIVAAGLAAMFIININPYHAPFWVIAIFYVSVFLCLMAIFALIGFYTKVWATNREVIFAHLKPTLRQGGLLSLLIVALLFLAQLRALNWWIAFLVVAAVGLVEMFFKSKKTR